MFSRIAATAAATVFMVCAAAPSFAQNVRDEVAYLRQRVQQLEAMIAQNGGGGGGNRMNAIEEQLRVLTGQVDMLMVRVQRLEGGAVNANPNSQSGSLQAPATPVPGNTSQLGTPPADLGQLRMDGEGRPLDITGLAQSLEESGANGGPMPEETVGGGNLGASSGRGSQMALAPSASPRDAYDQAYGQVLRGDYAAAERDFAMFIEQHPNHELVPNAKYWIGESFFQRGDYHNSARTFLDISRSHPESSKAPESMLKLGMSLAALQQREPACSSLNELTRRYPRADADVLDQATSEKRALGC
ncbi:tol-pal system protein YbgF [Tepidamorphus sp. 3E244]|uniref:tol-pal system protein YbgF n=1 Tax=Tepidamorphus sp. 3E244 TaxID=3385498 RepID=UPI0038FCE7BE